MNPDYDYDYARFHMRQHGIRSAKGWTNRLVIGEALHRGLEVTGTRSGLASIRSGKRRHWFLNGASSLNKPLARRCANLKEVTSRLLRSKGLSAAESTVFRMGDLDRAYRWAEPIFPVVVKPSNANKGRGVHVGISDFQEFREAFHVVERDFGEVLIEEQLFGVMHRITVVDGRVVAGLLQYPANVLGDGVTTVEELLRVKNADLGAIHKKITLDSNAEIQLAKQGHHRLSVPRDNERVYLSTSSNIATGGDAVDMTDEISPDVEQLLAEASRAIPGLRFAGYDVMLPENPQDGPASILEVNPQPGIHAHHFPRVGTSRDVARHLVEAMFPKEVN